MSSSPTNMPQAAAHPRSFVLASSNPHKLREFAAILAPLDCTLIPQSQLGIDAAEETGSSFVANALLKAHHVEQHTDQAILADDSGLEVEVLGGAPGLRSARYAQDHGSALSNLDYLLSRLATVSDARPRAHFVCAVVYLPGHRRPPLMFESSWSGYLVRTAVGDHGFAYDPIFYLPEYQCTAAQLAPAHKNAVSHRGRALQQLLAFLTAVGRA